MCHEPTHAPQQKPRRKAERVATGSYKEMGAAARRQLYASTTKS